MKKRLGLAQLSCQRMASKAVAPPRSQGSNWLFRHLLALAQKAQQLPSILQGSGQSHL